MATPSLFEEYKKTLLSALAEDDLLDKLAIELLGGDISQVEELEAGIAEDLIQRFFKDSTHGMRVSALLPHFDGDFLRAIGALHILETVKAVPAGIKRTVLDRIDDAGLRMELASTAVSWFSGE